ncbi:hypothetical protein COLO4_36095 [Corchorus olitorius]|uniref:Uncharacterized protein n=1 Tax=Corchorus olitorius TaxID=93759 RepID=A0A1R3GAZ8_9ROSI|nr:hypothetical protein COLO4_36095 [Corchorus olitorius]
MQSEPSLPKARLFVLFGGYGESPSKPCSSENVLTSESSSSGL